MNTQLHTSVLVVGGAGYIGSVVSYCLAAAGYDVIILDSLRYKQSTTHLKWARVVVGDCGDAAQLDDLFTTYRIAAVVHCAALIDVGESVRNPASFYATNVTASHTLLEAMRRHGVRDLIFSSSCAVYGMPARVPISEEEPFAPISPYGRTKVVMEYMMREYATAYGLRYVSLRYFNAAGALPEAGLGEFHQPEHHLIPLVLRALYHDKQFSLFGTDYDTPDGTAIRDFVHVHDIANAHLLALHHVQNKGVSEVFNLGTGRGYSIKEVIAAAEEATGKTVRVVPSERRAGDPARLVADATKAHDMLGWQPEYSSLLFIMQSALRWEMRNQFFSERARGDETSLI